MRFIRSFCALVIIAVPTVVNAGGIEIPDNGTRAMGRAGAYAAAVDEPSAIYYNPAALTEIDGFALTVNANLWFYDISFLRAPVTVEPIPGVERTYPFEAVENEDVVFPAPALFLSHDFGLDDWAFGFAVFGPSGIGKVTFPAPDLDDLADIGVSDDSARDWGHGYLMESSNMFAAFFSLAAAYDFGPVQVGLSVSLAMLNAEFVNAGDGGGITDPYQNSVEDPALYTRTTLNALGFAPAGTVSVRYQPIDELTLALSYRPRVVFNADGDLDIEFPPNLEVNDLSLLESGAHLNLTLPDVVRFGARWAFLGGEKEVADIELDFVYEAWSQLDAMTVDFDGSVRIGTLAQDRHIPQIVIPKHFNDTMSFRLGGDVHVTDALTVRAGTFIEGAANGDFFTQGSTKPGYANIDFVPFRRVGISLGATYEIADWSIDLALMHVFSKDHVEDQGDVDIIYPLWVCEDPQVQRDIDSCTERQTSPLHAINDGTYSVSFNLLSLGFTYNPKPSASHETDQ